MRLLLSFIGLAFILHSVSVTSVAFQPENEVRDPTIEFEIADKKLTLDHSCSVGALNEPEEELFGSSQSILIDSKGNLIVADRDAGEIRLFDETCRFVAATGRLGQGPGEFQWISSMVTGEDGRIIVFDNNNARLSFLELNDGIKLVESLSLDLAPTAIYRFYTYGDGRQFAIVGNITGKDELVHLYSKDGTYVNSFATLLKVADTYDNELIRNQVNQGLLIQLEDFRKIVALRSPYTLVKYDADNEVVWAVEEDLWGAPWEGYINITRDSYQVGVYPQILFAGMLNAELFVVEYADFEAETRSIDFRSTETGELVKRVAVDFERELVALRHDTSSSGLAVFGSSASYPSFSVYRWAIE
jgi:hypothetical protein